MNRLSRISEAIADTLTRTGNWEKVAEAAIAAVHEWQPIATVPNGERVLVYVPGGFLQHLDLERPRLVFEALARPDGHFEDPVYSEWDKNKGDPGATHWAPLPEPPK
jgi:hypothetical protein